MSVFGNAKKIRLKEEALNTEKWISDEELYSTFLLMIVGYLIMMDSQNNKSIIQFTNPELVEPIFMESPNYKGRFEIVILWRYRCQAV